MNISYIDPARQLLDVGTLIYVEDEVPLDDLEWKVLENLVRSANYDHVIVGDSEEEHSVHVARYINDVEKPVNLSTISGDITRIVMSEKMRDFYARFTGTSQLCLRRCQSNLLTEGDYIGLHKDQDSNPDYVATVVFHFESAYEGGDFVTHHPEHGFNAYHPGHRTLLVNNCEIPHQVKPVTEGKRLTLACFLSLNFGDSTTERHDFKLSH